MAIIVCYVKIILLMLVGSILACKYEQFGMDHTMCRFTSTTCPIIRREFSREERQEITRVHNDLRQKVANGKQRGQPRASNMRELVWSEELAKIAQRWAEQCVMGHDKNRRTSKFNYVGQNVYTFWSSSSLSNPNVGEAVKAWYDEVEKPGFDANQIDPFQFNYPAGHYTQLVWAETKAVGCGFVFYHKNNMYTHHTVCNYGPGGNIVGGQMYKVGTPCSKCTSGCSETYPGICRVPNQVNPNSDAGANGTIFKKHSEPTESNEDVKIRPPNVDFETEDDKDFIRMQKPMETLKKIFQTIFSFGESNIRAKPVDRIERQATYNYNYRNNNNNDPMWKRAYDFFFGPCEGGNNQ